jgi:parallel beta helix pectate lyase-like protein
MRHTPKLIALALTLFAIPVMSVAQSAPQPKCDGTTDDTAALQAAINDASAHSTKLSLPRGTCMLSAQTITLPDGLVLQGSGRDSTTLRRVSSAGNTSDMLSLNGKTGKVTITDITIDYNRAQQTGGASIVARTASTATGFTLQRSRLMNAPQVAVFMHITGSFATDVAISDNDFQNNGAAYSQRTDEVNGDIIIYPLNGLRLLNNTAEHTHGSFFLTGTGGKESGMGNFVITGNVLKGTEGFGIALGGGGPGRAHGSNVTIRDNDFSMANSRQNDIDVAYWDTIIIDHNKLIGGSCASGCAAVGDAPPSSHVTVTNNTIVANPALNTTACIALGGPGQIISNNTCEGSGGSGIVLFGDSTGSAGSIIENNTVKNCNQSQLGFHAGISLYLYKGTHMEGVTVRGNHSYDDRGSQATQSWGIIIDSGGIDPAGFKDVTIENNDVSKNKRGGIENNAHKSNIEIHNNVGYR